MDFLGDLLDTAFQSFSEHFREDELKNNSVKLTVDDSIGNMFMFLLVKNDTNFIWKRQVWNKRNDILRISNPVDSLKYITRKIIPEISRQNGVTDLELEEALEIFRFSNDVFDVDSNERSNKLIIDGTDYSLQINLNNSLKEFKWKSIPPHWRDIELLANKIIALNNSLY